MTRNARIDLTSLWTRIASTSAQRPMRFHGASGTVALADLAAASSLAGGPEPLRDRAVLLVARDQLAAGLALVELDGVARRLVLCTPDLDATRRGQVALAAGTDAVVMDAALDAPPPPSSIDCVVSARPMPMPLERRARRETEWILLTSGTSGTPKLVQHTLASLAGPLQGTPAAGGTAPEEPIVWSTFYDIRRYGGLQIYLRAVLGGASLVLSSAGEPVGDFLKRAAAAGVTHISGTPSHWRSALMSGDAARIDPRYVRLSGEVADQPLLDQLRATYPKARIAHAFASTEAGVGFEVNDGLAGFPAEFVGSARNGVEMRVVEGTLRIRSPRTAARYLGDSPALRDEDGFVDTGDMVELDRGRYHFRGRKGGVINVGGLKVYPEEIESVLNADPRVRMSLVRARRNPITGAVVVADVVLEDALKSTLDAAKEERVRNELIEACRRALPAHKVPAMLRFVSALEMSAAGKMVRPGA